MKYVSYNVFIVLSVLVCFPVNIALGRTCYQSSLRDYNVAKRAVDGNSHAGENYTVFGPD